VIWGHGTAVELGVSGRNLLILLRQIETKNLTLRRKGNLSLGLFHLCVRVFLDRLLTGPNMIARLKKLGRMLERIARLSLGLFEVAT
jgi:hypothetical protein